jgi:Protein of unknown function (DUF2961)/HEAT repeats
LEAVSNPSHHSRSRFPHPLPAAGSGLRGGIRFSLWTFCGLLAIAAARSDGGEYLDPLGLAAPKKFTAHRVSSASDAIFSNADRKTVMPGETLVMADLTGPGMITHIWLTNADNEFAWPRLLRLRVYYDGAKTPSVDAPLGDFFGVGHGYERNVESLMVTDSSSGRARNCYWPMPYRRSCRVTLTNEGQRIAPMLYYHVDYRDYESLPEDTRYFHAYYRQERPAASGKNYEFLSIRGTGHYVGTVLNVIQSQVSWFGEGDDLFYVDGAVHPQIAGTGSEDYFNDAWGLHVSSRLRTGTPVAEGEHVGARLTGYRWHIEDTIPFEKSLWAGVEHSGWTSNADGTVRAVFEERPDFFSSVAFWYQVGVNEGLAEPPFGADRLPLGHATQLSPGDYVKDATAKLGKISVLKEVDWGKDLLYFEAEGAGAQLNIAFEVPADGRYEVLAMVAQFSNYGNYTALLDGKPTNEDARQAATSEMPAGPEVFNNYQAELYVAVDRPLGWYQLTKGRHVLSFVCVGKDERSSGYKFGLNDLVLENVPAVPESSGPPSSPIPAAPELPGVVALPSAGPPVYRGLALTEYRKRIAQPARGELPGLLRAVGYFGEEGAPALPELTRALADPDEGVRLAAVWALTQVGLKTVTGSTELAHALSDASFRVRTLAASALSNRGANAAPAVPQLLQALDDRSDYVQARAADALGAIGPAARGAIAPLAAKLHANQGPAFVLASVADALGNLGPDAREALPALKERLEDPAFKALRILGSVRAAILKIEGKPVPVYR